jgi:hypothetical protein
MILRQMGLPSGLNVNQGGKNGWIGNPEILQGLTAVGKYSHEMDSFLFVRCPAEQSRTVNARIGGQTAFMFPPGRLSKNTELEIGELLKSQVHMSFPPISIYLTGVIRSIAHDQRF